MNWNLWRIKVSVLAIAVSAVSAFDVGALLAGWW